MHSFCVVCGSRFQPSIPCRCGQNLSQREVHEQHMPPEVVKQHQDAWLAALASKGARVGIASSKRIQEAK